MGGLGESHVCENTQGPWYWGQRDSWGDEGGSCHSHRPTEATVLCGHFPGGSSLELCGQFLGSPSLEQAWKC